MTYREKSNTYPTRVEAFTAALAAKKEAQVICDNRNADDPDLNEVVVLITDEANKRFKLTRPDVQEGIQVAYFVWEA